MIKASDYGQPKVRVRRLSDERRRLRRRRCYAVELTPLGASRPAWTRTTDDASVLLRRELGMHVVDAAEYQLQADGVWDGGVGPWSSIYPGDEQ